GGGPDRGLTGIDPPTRSRAPLRGHRSSRVPSSRTRVPHDPERWVGAHLDCGLSAKRAPLRIHLSRSPGATKGRNSRRRHPVMLPQGCALRDAPTEAHGSPSSRRWSDRPTLEVYPRALELRPPPATPPADRPPRRAFHPSRWTPHPAPRDAVAPPGNTSAVSPPTAPVTNPGVRCMPE